MKPLLQVVRAIGDVVCTVGLFLLLGVMLFATPAQAAQTVLSGAMVEALFRDAGRLSGYDAECRASFLGQVSEGHCDRAPVVVITDELGEGIAGLFNVDDPRKIYVTSSYAQGSPEQRMTIIHEMVHYMQWRAGRLHDGRSCLGHAALETEAYEVGNKYAAERGEPVREDAAFIALMYRQQCLILGM